MKENNDISFSEDYSVKNKQINNNEILQFREILLDKNKDIYINFKYKKRYIKIKNYSFLKINQMIETFPEENIYFLYNKKLFYTPRDSLRLSKSSINSIKDNNSFSSTSFKNENNKYIQEEIINTDINQDKDEIININNDQNNKEENIEFINNLKNMQNLQKITNENKNIKTINRKFIILKWIFHFYFIIGIILFLHYVSFIISKYNYYFYKWISILLIISLIYVGYIGIKKGHTNIKYYILDGDNLFWTNFSLLMLTIFSFIELCLVGGDFKFIKYQGFIGYLMVIIYIIIIIVESVYIIYYDRIIEEISWENINNNNINEINNNDNLHIQLMDIN